MRLTTRFAVAVHRRGQHVLRLIQQPVTGSVCLLQGDVASLEDLVREITAHNFHVTLPPELCPEEHAADGATGHKFIVWRCCTTGGSVLGGSITFAANSVFLLSGKGAHFRDTTFTGGPFFAQCGS